MSDIEVFNPATIKEEVIATPVGNVSCAFLEINTHDLHGELERNAADLAHFSAWEATATTTLAMAQQELEEIEATIWIELKARKDAGEKMTIDDMKALTRSDQRYVERKRMVINYEYQLSQLKTVRQALWRKGDLLQLKVHLHRSEMNRDLSIAAATHSHRATTEGR